MKQIKLKQLKCSIVAYSPLKQLKAISFYFKNSGNLLWYKSFTYAVNFHSENYIFFLQLND